MRAGEVKIRGVRLMQYASIGTFVASMATALKVEALPLWAILSGLPVLCFLAWVDPKIFKGESAYANKNNEEWQEIRNDIKAIKEHHADNTHKVTT